MKTRDIKLDDDMLEICRWFKNRKWPAPVIENIGPNFGLVAEDNGELLACAWVYITGRSLAYVDWIATNPDLPKNLTNDALGLVVEDIKKMCDKASPKIRALCLITKNESLAFSMAKRGFKKESEYHKLLWTSK